MILGNICKYITKYIDKRVESKVYGIQKIKKESSFKVYRNILIIILKN